MEQLPLRLLCRLDAPSVVPAEAISKCKSYREAVRLCWDLRKVRNMTRRTLAERAGLYAPHVTCYLEDGPNQRDLPGQYVKGFEAACDNCAVSQWLALQSHLTVVEELQLMRGVA